MGLTIGDNELNSDLQKFLRILSILAKTSAMGVELVRESQLIQKELLKKNVKPISFDANKSIYDISLLLKEISRQKFSGNDLENITKLIDTVVRVMEYEKIHKSKRKHH